MGVTDGVYTRGPYALDAARFTVDREVRIYTIGFGARKGEEGANDSFFYGVRNGLEEMLKKERRHDLWRILHRCQWRTASKSV